MRRGINITHLKGLLAYAKSERERYVRLERQELDLIIRELTSRRNETKKLRPKRNKQTKQILDLAAKVQESKMKRLGINQIDNACRAGRWVTALIGKRHVRIAGAVLRGKGKPFTKDHVWVNLWGGVDWRLVRLDSISLDRGEFRA